MSTYNESQLKEVSILSSLSGFLKKYLQDTLVIQYRNHQKQGPGIMKFDVQFDISLMMEHEPDVGNIFIKTFPLVIDNMSLAISKVLRELGFRDIKAQTVYCFPRLFRCPLFKFPKRDPVFQKNIIDSQTGNLIHLKRMQVIQVNQPELFLYAQYFKKSCDCSSKSDLKSNDCDSVSIAKSVGSAITGKAIPLQVITHTFLSMIKYNSENLREAANSRQALSYCQGCSSPFEEVKELRVYQNCMKIIVFSDDLLNEDTIFGKHGIATLWVPETLFSKQIQIGNVLYGLCYYDMAVNFMMSETKDRMYGVSNELLIALDLRPSDTQSNNLYLKQIHQFLHNEFQFSDPPCFNKTHQNQDFLYNEWQKIMEVSNLLFKHEFPLYSYQNLQLGLLLSLFSANYQNLIASPGLVNLEQENQKLNMLVIYEDETHVTDLMMRVVNCMDNGMVFPYEYDKDTLVSLLMKANEGIILVPDVGKLKKVQLSLIERIVKSREIQLNDRQRVRINSTIWMLAPISQIKNQKRQNNNSAVLVGQFFDNQPLTDIFDIVVDISQYNNLKKGVQINTDQDSADLLLNPFYQENNQFQFDRSKMMHQMIMKTQKSFPTSQISSHSALQDTLKTKYQIQPEENQNREQIKESTGNDKNLKYFYNHLFVVSIPSLASYLTNEDFAQDLLQSYFLKLRQNQVKMNFINFESLYKLAKASALARKFLCRSTRTKSFAQFDSQINIDPLDSAIAIMLTEETALNKYGPFHVVFGGRLSTLLLNAQNSPFLNIYETSDFSDQDFDDFSSSLQIPLTLDPDQDTQRAARMKEYFIEHYDMILQFVDMF